MQLPVAHLSTFLALLYVSPFTTTVLASAIPNPTPAYFETSVRSLLHPLKNCVQPPDCGSSPFQTPCIECNSASSLHLPFRTVFKLPALLINNLAFGTGKARAAAVSLPSLNQVAPSTLDRDSLVPSLDLKVQKIVKERSSQVDAVGNHCGLMEGGFELFPCNAASDLKVPSVFRLPTLFIRDLVLISKSLASALPATVDDIGKRCEADPGVLFCFHINAASCLRRIPSFFTVPTILLNAIASLPSAMAAATPIHNKKERGDAETFSPNVELTRLSHSLTPSFSNFRSLFPHVQKMEALKERDYPPYCNCNEDTCWDSPPCCANGSCLSNAASGLKVPSIFTIPVLAINAITTIPGTMAAAIPPVEDSLSSIRSLFSLERREVLSESLEKRQWDLCQCPMGEGSCTLADCCSTGHMRTETGGGSWE